MKMFRPCLAEFLGTFILCFAAIASILSQTMLAEGSGIVAIALANGLALSVAVNAFGGISGAHFNPAVTIGMLSTGRIAGPLAGAYVFSQLLGAMSASIVCRAAFPTLVVEKAFLGIPRLGDGVSAGVAVLIEFILTFLLMLAIFGTAVDERGKFVKIGAFGIGLAVTFEILAAGALTGASMNPARSFGPALVHGYFEDHWIYWFAPIAGACAAAALYQHVLLKNDSEIT